MDAGETPCTSTPEHCFDREPALPKWRHRLPKHQLTYALDESDTLQCANTSCVGIQFFEAEDIAYDDAACLLPTICDGDDLEITVVAVPAISTHEWVTSLCPTKFPALRLWRLGLYRPL